MVNTNGLSPNQAKQVANAPQAQKAKLAAAYRSQTAIQRMPRASAGKRGVMPDVTKYHFGQTPASSNVIAPRGFGYYDAFAHNPQEACTAYSVGPATGIVGASRTTISTHAPATPASGYSGVVLMVVCPTLSSNQAIIFSDNAGTMDISFVSSPQLVADPPQTAIPTRCSLRLRNITAQIAKGGVIRTLRLTTGFQIPANLTALDALCENIRNHDRTRTYAGSSLADDFQINCTVVDQSRATSFDSWGAEGFQHFLLNPSYSPIAILFEPFAISSGSSLTLGSVNNYEVTIRSQFLARYAQGTMLANLAVPPPAVGDVVNKLRDHEESKGSALQRVADAALNYVTNTVMPGFAIASEQISGTPIGTEAKIMSRLASQYMPGYGSNGNGKKRM